MYYIHPCDPEHLDNVFEYVYDLIYKDVCELGGDGAGCKHGCVPKCHHPDGRKDVRKHVRNHFRKHVRKR